MFVLGSIRVISQFISGFPEFVLTTVSAVGTILPDANYSPKDQGLKEEED